MNQKQERKRIDWTDRTTRFQAIVAIVGFLYLMYLTGFVGQRPALIVGDWEVRAYDESSRSYLPVAKLVLHSGGNGIQYLDEAPHAVTAVGEITYGYEIEREYSYNVNWVVNDGHVVVVRQPGLGNLILADEPMSLYTLNLLGPRNMRGIGPDGSAVRLVKK